MGQGDVIKTLLITWNENSNEAKTRNLVKKVGTALTSRSMRLSRTMLSNFHARVIVVTLRPRHKRTRCTGSQFLPTIYDTMRQFLNPIKA